MRTVVVIKSKPAHFHPKSCALCRTACPQCDVVITRVHHYLVIYMAGVGNPYLQSSRSKFMFVRLDAADINEVPQIYRIGIDVLDSVSTCSCKFKSDETLKNV